MKRRENCERTDDNDDKNQWNNVQILMQDLLWCSVCGAASQLEKWPLSHRPRFIFVPKQVALSYILAALRKILDKS